MPRTIDVNVKYFQGVATITGTIYQDKSAAMLLHTPDGEPLAKATINIQDKEIANGSNDVVIIKDYSENEGMLNALVDNEIIKLMSYSINDNVVAYIIDEDILNDIKQARERVK